SKSPSLFARQHLVFDLLSSILMNSPPYSSTHDSFRLNNGYETGMNTLLRLASTFSADPNPGPTEEGAHEIISSIFNLFSSSLLSSLASRTYFNTNVSYSALAASLLSTGIFSSPTYSSSALALTLTLISPPPHPPSSLQNIDAIKFLFYTATNAPSPLPFIPLLDTVASLTDHQLHRNTTLTSSHNLTHTLTTTYNHVLSSSSHPLQPSFFSILTNLSSSYMSTSDFLSLLTYVR
ncbi:hypothetical protein TeGR_g7375, partial [Tetraparma gracilis]